MAAHAQKMKIVQIPLCLAVQNPSLCLHAKHEDKQNMPVLISGSQPMIKSLVCSDVVVDGKVKTV